MATCILFLPRTLHANSKTEITHTHTQGEILLRDTGGARLLLSGIHFPHAARSFLFANWLPSHLEHLVSGTDQSSSSSSSSSSASSESKVCIRQRGARHRIVDANGTVVGTGPVVAPCQDASGALSDELQRNEVIVTIILFYPLSK